MRRRSRITYGTSLLLAASQLAHAGLSQSQLEDDCLRRLQPIVPRDVKVKGVDFSALGNYGTYYVVSYRFTGELANGKSVATCTFQRERGWVKDDAATYKALRELETSRQRAKAH